MDIRLDTPTLTSRGFIIPDMDRVMATVTDALKRTAPTTTKDGRPGRAKYGLTQEITDESKDRVAELLDLHPLHPGLTL